MHRDETTYNLTIGSDVAEYIEGLTPSLPSGANCVMITELYVYMNNNYIKWEQGTMPFVLATGGLKRE